MVVHSRLIDPSRKLRHTCIVAASALLLIPAFAQTVPANTDSCRVINAHTLIHPIAVDRFGSEASSTTLIFLHGSSGAAASRAWAQRLAAHNLLVLLPHYYEAASGNNASDQNYADWAQAVLDTIQRERLRPGPKHTFALMGYSLGASIALALSTQCNAAPHVIAWSGSLPDFFYLHRRTMPHLLIIHGEKDTVVPYINATQLATLCTRTATSCQLLPFKNQDHHFNPETTKEAEDAILHFIQSTPDAVSR